MKQLKFGDWAGWFVICLALGLALGSCKKPLVEIAHSPTATEATAAASQGEKLVFAALSGTSPQYIDEGPYKGQGWLEYQTRSIRKGLTQDGIPWVTEYMTPARIAHEFRKNTPICFYPVEWSHPKREFQSRPDRILSVPLNLVGDSNRSILIDRKDLPKFRKHLDEKGDLKLESLISDRTLKSVLVRDRDYGLLNHLVTQIDDRGDQEVKPEFRKQFELLSVHENRQILDMLNAKRFDYTFWEAIQDLELQVGSESGQKWLKIPFGTSRVRDKSDPNLTYVSVACSLHPQAMVAMTSINKAIKQIRGLDWTEKSMKYRSKWDAKMPLGYAKFDSLISRFTGQFEEGHFDEWHTKQEGYFPRLKETDQPPPGSVARDSQAGTTPIRPPRWKVVVSKKAPKELLIYNESYSLLRAQKSGYRFVGFDQTVWYYPTDKLAENFSALVSEDLKNGFEETQTHTETRFYDDFDALPFDELKNVSQITAFVGGLDQKRLEPFAKWLESHARLLEGVSIHHMGSLEAKRIVALLASPEKDAFQIDWNASI